MRFRVENLGPLREAEVDLGKRLIVLTGPNNTGKTYFATAVYGFFRSRSSVSAGLEAGMVRGRFGVSSEELRPFVADALLERARQLETQLDQCFGASDKTFAIAHVAANAAIEDIRKALTALSAESWGRTTGAGVGYVRRSSPRSGTVQFAIVSESFVRDLRQDKAPWSDDDWARLPVEEGDGSSDAIVASAQRALRGLFDDLLNRRSRIFPAERVVMSLFAREIAAARTQLADALLNAPDTAASVQRLAWPVSDAVLNALHLPDAAKQSTAFADLADSLEREILGGSVAVSRHGAATFTPRETSALLDVQQSASVVKSLSSLVFYFRHQAQKGDFLLIDEPELNLHPDNQRKVARFLAQAVNRGFRILISTHSDYVLRELNHLLQLGRADGRAKKLVHDLGYPEDALLRPEDIGVYLFQDGTAKDVEVSEEGFEVKTIEDEIAKLNEIQQKIYSAFLD